MTKKYRVLFYGLSGDEEGFRSCMGHLGALPEAVDKMITKAPVILKEGLTLAFSTRYADAVRKAGGMAEVQEHGYFEASMNHTISIASFKDFTMCPECGLKQQKRETCVKCGFRLVNMENGLEPKNVAGN
ncbi:MAG: hypothetical protein JRJ20_02305 [Deltaproteobacteria bacterium]|nr:hypothetical protein [Deltaproteobacteria bacterium]